MNIKSTKFGLETPSPLLFKRSNTSETKTNLSPHPAQIWYSSIQLTPRTGDKITSNTLAGKICWISQVTQRPSTRSVLAA